MRSRVRAPLTRRPCERIVLGVVAATVAVACQSNLPPEGNGAPTEPGNSGGSSGDLENLGNSDWPEGKSVVCELGPSDGLVAYFSGDDGLFDADGAHEGILVPLRPTGEYGAIERHPSTGAAAPIAPGQDGEAFDFAGTSFIEIPDAPQLNPTVGLTLSAWVYVTGGTTYLDIVGKDGETEDRQYLLGVSKNWRFRAHVGTVERLRYFDGNTSVEEGTWYYVAMTYDVPSGELILYVNGDQDGSQVIPEGRRCISVTREPLRIGGGAPEGRAQLPFYGLIDEVRVYDRALTQDQIRQLYGLQEPDVPRLVPAGSAPAPDAGAP